MLLLLLLLHQVAEAPAAAVSCWQQPWRAARS
jgi:hypothetical protein